MGSEQEESQDHLAQHATSHTYTQQQHHYKYSLTQLFLHTLYNK